MVPKKVSQNDSGTALRFVVLDQDKKTVNLTGATVLLYIERSDTVLIKTCTIVDALLGIVQYVTSPTDFSIGDDTYYLKIRINFQNGNQFTAIDNIPIEVIKSPVF